MGFWDKVKATFGVGQPKMEASLTPEMLKAGQTLEVQWTLTGGTREVPIKDFTVGIFKHTKRRDSEGKETWDVRRVENKVFEMNDQILAPGQKISKQAQIQIPGDAPESKVGRNKYTLVVKADVPGMDPKKTLRFTITG